MDAAEVGTMRVGYFRVGSFIDNYDRIKSVLTNSSGGSIEVTRRKLVLSARDSVTGWYRKDYAEETIDMYIQPVASQNVETAAGNFARETALGFTADVVAEGDEIQCSSKYYEVKTVTPVYYLDSFMYRTCNLNCLSLHE